MNWSEQNAAAKSAMPKRRSGSARKLGFSGRRKARMQKVTSRRRRSSISHRLAFALKFASRKAAQGQFDILAANLDPTVPFDSGVSEPWTIFANLDVQEIESLREEILAFLALGQNMLFWESLLVICDDELRNGRQANASAGGGKAAAAAAAGKAARGVHPTVMEEIKRELEGKSYDELVEMEQQIRDQFQEHNVLDAEYWDTLLDRLTVQKARKRLADFHLGMLKHRLETLEKMKKEGKLETPAAVSVSARSAGPRQPNEDLKEFAKVVDSNDFAEEDAIENLRAGMTADDMVAAESAKGMDEDEEVFNLEVPLEGQAISWKDKYRPRKPKFFNRVHTGFDWNKYNQTHYDSENPPPGGSSRGPSHLLEG
eukprot:TRINITY_DN2084_c1_g1_i2.p1 TRINITY_DN2084_c1_g1~~TRINITY_DN2084_c1_g1_i2.p1  ORF type:complete len:371 (-),score=71.79 TRINITY_DN2084_c1_g1_i2:375-1487(-)